MELKPEQIQRFKEIHANCAGFEDYTDEQISVIANNVANYYVTLFNVSNRISKESEVATG